MSESPIGDAPVKVKGILSRKVLGIPVLYIAVVFVGVLALYAWRTKSTAAPEESEAVEGEEAEAEEIPDNLYPISPTGTVYAQSPEAVEDNTEYFGNDQWLQKAVAGMVAKGKNPGEVQNALQAYLAGEDMTYDQGLIRDQAVKDYGLPPESFRAGVSAPKPVKPVPPKTDPPPVVKPPTNPPPVVKPPVTTPKPTTPRKTHRVVRGDTLWHIAKRYYGDATQWPKIASANKISNPRTLQIGRVLVIP